MCTYFIAKAEHKLIGESMYYCGYQLLPTITPHGDKKKDGPTDNTALRLKHLLNR